MVETFQPTAVLPDERRGGEIHDGRGAQLEPTETEGLVVSLDIQWQVEAQGRAGDAPVKGALLVFGQGLGARLDLTG